MSAFVVPRLHVDLLVKVALTGPSDADDAPWKSFPLRNVDRAGRKLTNAVRDITTEIRPTALGSLWFGANVRSVMHRYPETIDGGSVPGSGEEWAEAYRYTDPGYRMTCAETARAIDGLANQSYGHPEWIDSDAKCALDRLGDAVLEHLPGAGSAPAIWTDEDLRARGVER